MNLGKSRRMTFFLAIAGLLVLVMVMSPQPVRATGPRYVAMEGVDGGNDCTNSSTPCATVQHAVDEADPGDTIFVAVGTYTGTGEEAVLLDKSVALSGGWDGGFGAQTGASMIDGEETRHCIRVVDSAICILDRFIARDGTGSAIYNQGTLTLENSIVNGNTSDRFCGGGICNEGGTLILKNSAVSGNTARAGYGGGIENGGTLILEGSIVEGNEPSGIYNRGPAKLSNSTRSVAMHVGSATATL